MTCIKTGCHAYLAEYGKYVYGDAYEVGATVILRISQRSFDGPLSKRLHFTVHRIGQWFDKDREDVVSTLISNHTVNHGYEGI